MSANSASRHGDSPPAGRGAAARLLDRALDRTLVTAVARAGTPGRIRFTERQLYFETCRVLRPPRAVPRGIPVTPAPPVRYERFAAALIRHGPVAGLLGPLPGPVPLERRTLREPREADLYDYGLPRMLICQSRAVARMLLANDVHLEAACPVFAADRLPLDPRLVAGLGKVEGATVHVLHDASVSGIALTARVRGELPGVRVVSMGLVPRHAAALHLISGRAPGPGAALDILPAGIEPRERDWLAGGRFAEVEAVAPARLLRTVLRVVRGTRTPSHSLWSGLRELRTTGFLTWPVTNPGDPTTRGSRGDEPATRNPVQR
ncbi:hypothetical protein [Streptomyces sp. NPDC088725]|uniref:hypothetical protein n=1 Tax=Streptomyces sp. NPDC088725 TaxID=3365873 RepID=UPI003808CB25